MMDAISTRLNEIQEISDAMLDQTSQIFTQALDMTQQELAGAMKVWLEAPLEQKLDERESLAVGYLTTFFLHSKLCDAVAGGNIIDIVEAVGEFQTVLFRLAGAGLVIDPKAITGRAIAVTLKKGTEDANKKRREQGEETKQKVAAELSKKSWRKPYNKSRIAEKISKKTGIKEETVRPIVAELLKGDNNS